MPTPRTTPSIQRLLAKALGRVQAGWLGPLGEEVSSREVKKILQEAVEGEDKRKPLSDEKLGQVLNAKGYNIARRTVAKYREQLGIPVARLRKELS